MVIIFLVHISILSLPYTLTDNLPYFGSLAHVKAKYVSIITYQRRKKRRSMFPLFSEHITEKPFIFAQNIK